MRGVVFPISQIANIDRPNPTAWIARTSSVSHVDVSSYSRRQLATYLRERGKTERDVIEGRVAFTRLHSYAHDGGEFVHVDADEFGLINVRWSAVHSYAVAD